MHEEKKNLLIQRVKQFHARLANLIIEDRCLNQGIMVFDGYQAGGTIPVRLEGAGLALEVLKKAEKEKCLIIRVVETLGCRSFGTLTVTEPTACLVETNLMEWINGPEIKCRKPFEINLT